MTHLNLFANLLLLHNLVFTKTLGLSQILATQSLYLGHCSLDEVSTTVQGSMSEVVGNLDSVSAAPTLSGMTKCWFGDMQVCP